jgi:CMP-2-keto-3-deoxyoctulosonic acid synthetase
LQSFQPDSPAPVSPENPSSPKPAKPLIQHVVEQVRKCQGLDRIVVATDDERICRP